MEKTSLQKMIDLWIGIHKLHFDAMVQDRAGGVDAFSRNVRLRDKSQMVLSALTHYQIELER